jgi:hypothetical protein
MPIARLLSDAAFTPEQTREMIYAYEGVLTSLNLSDRTDPICELVARQIIACATGEFDRASLYDCALSKLTDEEPA